MLANITGGRLGAVVQKTKEDIAAIRRIKSVPTILKVVARTSGLRFAAIARVTECQWLACAVHDEINFGIKAGDELPVETTICNEVRQHGQAVMFGSTSDRPEFSRHPTPKLYGFESYVSVPIHCSGGRFFGTLFALDRRATKFDDAHIIETLELFAELIANSLDSNEQLERAAGMLATAKENAKLREQFIAVLGHDLRNPLHAIAMSAEALSMTLAGDLRKQSLVDGIKRSVKRMSELILNILDFARGKLGDGIPVTLKPNAQLGEDLHQVIAEIRSAHPERELTSDVELVAITVCDGPRVAQLLGNLLANAMTHGAVDHPVHVALKSDAQQFEMSVRNGGPCIPAVVIPNLFEPFTRSGPGASPDGLGLGLYIAKQIAEAHRGTLEVSSNEHDGTCFVFRMTSQIN